MFFYAAWKDVSNKGKNFHRLKSRTFKILSVGKTRRLWTSSTRY